MHEGKIDSTDKTARLPTEVSKPGTGDRGVGRG